MTDRAGFVLLHREVVGSFIVEDGNKAVFTFNGGMSLLSMLDRADRENKEFSLRTISSLRREDWCISHNKPAKDCVCFID